MRTWRCGAERFYSDTSLLVKPFRRLRIDSPASVRRWALLVKIPRAYLTHLAHRRQLHHFTEASEVSSTELNKGQIFRGATLAVYVDNARIAWRGRQWCHLVADSLDELHRFATSLGLRRGWFQAQASLPHYDVTVEVRDIALSRGAHAADRRTLVMRGRQLKLELQAQIANQNSQLKLFD